MSEHLITRTLLQSTSQDELRLSEVNHLQRSLSFAPLSLKYVVSGTEHYYVGKKHIALQTGEFLFGGQHVQSEIIIDHAQPVRGLCVDLSRDTLHQVMDYHFKSPEPLRDFIRWDECRVSHQRLTTHTGSYFRQLHGQFESLLTDDVLLTQELFFQLACLWLQDRSVELQQFQRLRVVKPETQRRLFRFLREIKEYIETHYHDNLSISRLASEASLSEYHFLRLFKQVFGMSPYQLILRCRINSAATLLQQGWAVQEAAYQVGFSDVSAFRKAFKQLLGKSPSEWVRN